MLKFTSSWFGLCFSPLAAWVRHFTMMTCVVSVTSSLTLHKMFIACAAHAQFACALPRCACTYHGLLLCSYADHLIISRMLDTLYPPLSFLWASCGASRACFCTYFDLGLYRLSGYSLPLQLRRRLAEVDAFHFMTVFSDFCRAFELSCSVSLRCGSFSGLFRLDPSVRSIVHAKLRCDSQ